MIVMWVCWAVMVGGFVAARVVYGDLPDDAIPEWRLVAGGICFIVSVAAAMVGLFACVYTLGASS